MIQIYILFYFVYTYKVKDVNKKILSLMSLNAWLGLHSFCIDHIKYVFEESHSFNREGAKFVITVISAIWHCTKRHSDGRRLRGGLWDCAESQVCAEWMGKVTDELGVGEKKRKTTWDVGRMMDSSISLS